MNFALISSCFCFKRLIEIKQKGKVEIKKSVRFINNLLLEKKMLYYIDSLSKKY